MNNSTGFESAEQALRALAAAAEHDRQWLADHGYTKIPSDNGKTEDAE